jgi:hypothetical protein
LARVCADAPACPLSLLAPTTTAVLVGPTDEPKKSLFRGTAACSVPATATRAE